MTALLSPSVVSAKAGIQCLRQMTLDSRLRGKDEIFPLFGANIGNINNAFAELHRPIQLRRDANKNARKTTPKLDTFPCEINQPDSAGGK